MTGALIARAACRLSAGRVARRTRLLRRPVVGLGTRLRRLAVPRDTSRARRTYVLTVLRDPPREGR